VKITLAAAVAASGARVLRFGALPIAAPFSTDTRTLVPGDVYVALRGAAFDGHAFVDEALACGASGVVVDDAHAVPPDIGALVVTNTTAAYLAFAGVARLQMKARVVAITGSAGKTTTKHVLAGLLEAVQPGRVVATHANENNEIGVAKLFLGAPEETAYVVVEFGARHFGEIAPLARAARPDVAVLTNIGDAHLEMFGSRERLRETKYGIFATGARAVLPALRSDRGFTDDDSPRDDVGAASSDARAGRPRTYFFATDVADPEIANTAHLAETTVVLEGRDRLVVYASDGANGADGTSFETRVAVAGDHNLRNVAAAAAAAVSLGIAPARIAEALRDADLPAGRYERITLGTLAVVYDAYNASMGGMLATLASFEAEPATRRIVVLGSMAELGVEAPAMHARVGAAVASAKIAYVLVGGDFASDLARGARAAGFPGDRIVVFTSNVEAVTWLDAHARDGDRILLKASRRYRFEEIVDGLRASRTNDDVRHA
jgi:UDP-N-acetylmuramoyl-tripeptide--D-alanyl-D-alanine ligase